MYNSKEINLYNLIFEETKENNYLSSCSCLLLLLEIHWFRILLEEWNTTFFRYLQEALWIVPRMSSPLKTPKLDSWGHPPTHALTILLLLHRLLLLLMRMCHTCLQLKSFQGTFLCKCCFCTIFETLVLSYTFQWYELHLDQHFDFKHGKNNFYWFVPKSPAFCLNELYR